jgi:glycosyltransferase involved in cell wall biosynthesis
MKILFFIGSLRSGGKERRLIELLTWLKQQSSYELYVVLTYDSIDYPAFHELGIPYRAFFKKLDYRWPSIYWKLDRLCKEFKPDIIHTWGYMRTFNMLPIALRHKIPVVSSEITDAKPRNGKLSVHTIISRINFRFASIVTSNSFAGLKSFGLQAGGKYKVILNGVSMSRFVNLPESEHLKKQFRLTTKYAVIMAASFSDSKDFDKYLDICAYLSKKRNDITFYAVGDGGNFLRIKNRAQEEKIENLVFTGRINNVESLISICDIGLLFSPLGEGISNSIMEYMALGKPVIANDAGGTKEIVQYEKTGYLIKNETIEEIASRLEKLIDDLPKRSQMGKEAQKRINEHFSLSTMGAAFEKLYLEVSKHKA